MLDALYPGVPPAISKPFKVSWVSVTSAWSVLLWLHLAIRSLPIILAGGDAIPWIFFFKSTVTTKDVEEWICLFKKSQLI